jgi:hypothetical protein
MNAKETDGKRDPSGAAALLKVLTEQRRVLIAANGHKSVIEQYTSLLGFLKSASDEELHRILRITPIVHNKIVEVERSEAQISNMSLGEIQALIAEDSTSRKLLERIAIYRFRVPRGSMRSFSNRKMLIEKLSTLLQNEQTHATIEDVARLGKAGR